MRLILFLIGIFMYFNFFGQTYIRPIIGVDFASISELKRDIEFDVYGNGFYSKSFLMGLAIDHRIFKKSEVSIRSTITSKFAKASIFNILGYNSIKYWNIKNSLNFKYNATEKIAVYFGLFYGIGLNYSVSNSNNSSNLGNFKEFGPVLCAEYRISKFAFTLSYFQGTNIYFTDKSNRFQPYIIKPPNSIVIDCSYRFKVKEKHRKKIECPEF